MVNITEILTPQKVIDYTNDRQYPTQTGEALFPSVKQNTMELDYIMGGNGVPVSASVHALDTQTEIGSREGFERIKQNVALVKRQYAVNEQLLLQLNDAREGSGMYNNVIDSIFNDVDRAVQAVQTRIERFRYEALGTGQIKVSENGANFVVDYGLQDNQTTDATTKWDATDANPINDLYKLVDDMIGRGVIPSCILTSRRVLNIMLDNDNLKKMIIGEAGRRITPDELNQFLSANSLPVIGTEDRVYRTQDANGTTTTHRYFPDDRLVFLPEGTVGRTIFAPTPQELRLAGKPGVDIGSVGNILTMVYDRDVDPVATYTLATAHVLPSFERANEIHIAKVLNPQA